ncbi:DUF2523 domain-containing protein [Pseudomonas otitidis]|uniref:DUF2523 domain-containing protein n=1 Tax=Metapseudomonas otitidis TaxID=319939 RepID=A0A7X3H7X8_9GAMM|nr:DUF2523 family protein [Pseudomonas otitidis]MWK56689.1 DUF2523 domain-containing protein [Pseudomonas otitidis]MWK56700.1 DUF2523 domain-containing protein [Pseudomonas otitidis]
MEWIAEFFNSVTTFFQDLWNWLYDGLYVFAKAFLVTATKAMIYAYLQTLLICIDIAYTAVQEILQETGVMDKVVQTYNLIPSVIRGYLGFFNVPQGLGLILSAIPTRWAMKFVPFFGR